MTGQRDREAIDTAGNFATFILYSCKDGTVRRPPDFGIRAGLFNFNEKAGCKLAVDSASLLKPNNYRL